MRDFVVLYLLSQLAVTFTMYKMTIEMTFYEFLPATSSAAAATASTAQGGEDECG